MAFMWIGTDADPGPDPSPDPDTTKTLSQILRVHNRTAARLLNHFKF
jgi:hypothetical protein